MENKQSTPIILLDPQDPRVERYFIIKDLALVKKETQKVRDHVNKAPLSIWNHTTQQMVIEVSRTLQRSYMLEKTIMRTLNPHLN